MHRAHHVGVGIESAACETDVGRPVFAVTLHQVAAAADHAHRQTAAQCFAVGDHVGAHAEIALRATRCQSKTHEHLVEDQHDASRAADLAQLLQPCRVGLTVECGAAAAVQQGVVARRRLVGVQGLQRVDQHAGDVAALAQHTQGVRIHLFQRVGVGRRQRVAGPGLHVFPPAVMAPEKRTRHLRLV